MRRSAFLCAVAVSVCLSPAWAQTPLAPGDFGALGMYPKRLSCSDLPVFSEPKPVHRLLAAHTGDGQSRRAFAAPDTLVIPGGTGSGLQPGQQFFVRRLLTSPDHAKPTQAAPGTVHTAGWITVTAADGVSALARVDYACDGFIRGDYLEPFTPTTLPTTLAQDGTAQFADMGQLLFGSDGRRAFANGDLIVVNRGSSHGMTAGARLTIFRDPKNTGPLVEVGRAIVLAVSGETSTVVVDRVNDALYAGDWFGTQAAARQP